MGGLHWRSLMDILRSPCTSHHDGQQFCNFSCIPAIYKLTWITAYF